MSPPVKQCTFAGGEVSPQAFARSDLSLYEKSARTLRNMICMKHGGVTARPATMYVGNALNGGNQVRLIPFIFNETGLGQSYVLEFGNQYIAFYQNGGVVITAPNTPYTIATPYLQADLQNLKFGQSADIITIVHQSYAPMELARYAPTNWVLSTINFSNTAQRLSSNVVFSGGGSGSSVYTYLVSAVDGATGDEIEYGRSIVGGEIGTGLINTISPTNPGVLSWGAAPGAAYYRIYRSDENGDGQVLGFIGQTAALSFRDAGFVPDFTNAPIQYSSFGSPFGSLTAGNYPSVVGFVQQRRGFGSTANNPIGFWFSQPGSYSNFAVHLGSPVDSDAVIGSLSGEEVNQLEALLELKFALMLTTGAEIYVQGNGSGVVTPSAINASTQSQYGCSSLRPLKVGDVLLFCQSLGSKIRDFAFDFAIDGYRGNDISIFASHLFEGYQIVDWCYQKTPDSIIWVVRSDGVLLSCTYIREQQVLAWTRHDIQGSFVENVCAIPENGEYAVYASVRNTISATNRYIVRLASRVWQGPEAAVATGTANAVGDPIDSAFMDYYLNFDGRNNREAGTLMTLTSSSPNLAIAAVGPFPTDLRIQFTTPHGFSPGDKIFITGLSKATILNGGNFLVGAVLNPMLISITDLAGNQLVGPVYATGENPATGIVETFSTASQAYQQQLTLTASSAFPHFFNSNMIGDQIFLQDSLWISSQGKDGNEVRCTIQEFINDTQVIVTPDSEVPIEFQNVAIQIWAHAVSEVSGLNHLVDQQVSVWADRFVVGSPLNSHYSKVYTVAGNGTLTLDKPYSVIYVGLPIIEDVETLDLETFFGETMMGRRKRMAGLYGYLYNTRSFYAGSENPDNNNQNTTRNKLFQLFPMRTGLSQDSYGEPPTLISGQNYLITMARWNMRGGIFMRNVDPLPWTLLAVSPKEEDPVQGTYKRV